MSTPSSSGTIRGRAAAPQKRKLVIAIPTAQGLTKAVALTSLAAAMQTAARLGYAARFLHVDGSDIVSARNHFATMTLRDAAASYLLFIDSDMQVEAAAIEALFTANKDVIGAIYARKQQHPRAFVVRTKPGAKPVNGLVPVLGIGMGLALIRASVFKAFEGGGLLTEAPSLARAYNLPGLRTGFFDPMTRDGDQLSEDYSFCQRWIDLGGEVWGLPTDKVAHVGDFAYRGVFSP